MMGIVIDYNETGTALNVKQSPIYALSDNVPLKVTLPTAWANSCVLASFERADGLRPVSAYMQPSGSNKSGERQMYEYSLQAYQLGAEGKLRISLTVTKDDDTLSTSTVCVAIGKSLSANPGDPPEDVNAFNEALTTYGTTVAGLTTRTTALEELTTEHDSDIKALEELTTEHDSDIKALEELTTEHDSDIKALEELTTGSDGTITGLSKLTARTTTLEDITASHNADIAALDMLTAAHDVDLTAQMQLGAVLKEGAAMCRVSAIEAADAELAWLGEIKDGFKAVSEDGSAYTRMGERWESDWDYGVTADLSNVKPYDGRVAVKRAIDISTLDLSGIGADGKVFPLRERGVEINTLGDFIQIARLDTERRESVDGFIALQSLGYIEAIELREENDWASASCTLTFSRGGHEQSVALEPGAGDTRQWIGSANGQTYIINEYGEKRRVLAFIGLDGPVNPIRITQGEITLWHNDTETTDGQYVYLNGGWSGGGEMVAAAVKEFSDNDGSGKDSTGQIRYYIEDVPYANLSEPRAVSEMLNYLESVKGYADYHTSRARINELTWRNAYSLHSAFDNYVLEIKLERGSFNQSSPPSVNSVIGCAIEVRTDKGTFIFNMTEKTSNTYLGVDTLKGVASGSAAYLYYDICMTQSSGDANVYALTLALPESVVSNYLYSVTVSESGHKLYSLFGVSGELMVGVRAGENGYLSLVKQKADGTELEEDIDTNAYYGCFLPILLMSEQMKLLTTQSASRSKGAAYAPIFKRKGGAK